METEVKIPARGATLDGNLTVPPAARGIVLLSMAAAAAGTASGIVSSRGRSMKRGW